MEEHVGTGRQLGRTFQAGGEGRGVGLCKKRGGENPEGREGDKEQQRL